MIGLVYVCLNFVDPPSMPTNLRVTDYGKEYIDISWSPPETDGGSPLSQYIIEKRDMTHGTGSWMVSGTVSPSETRFRVGKLLLGNAYQFRVTAENRVGVGPPAEMEDVVTAQLPFGMFSSNQFAKIYPSEKLQRVQHAMRKLVLCFIQFYSLTMLSLTSTVVQLAIQFYILYVWSLNSLN